MPEIDLSAIAALLLLAAEELQSPGALSNEEMDDFAERLRAAARSIDPDLADAADAADEEEE